MFSVIGQPVPFLLGPQEVKITIATMAITERKIDFFININLLGLFSNCT
jgi:hypothetical protein